jgi:hypothetical protein
MTQHAVGSPDKLDEIRNDLHKCRHSITVQYNNGKQSDEQHQTHVLFIKQFHIVENKHKNHQVNGKIQDDAVVVGLFIKIVGFIDRFFAQTVKMVYFMFRLTTVNDFIDVIQYFQQIEFAFCRLLFVFIVFVQGRFPGQINVEENSKITQYEKQSQIHVTPEKVSTDH